MNERDRRELKRERERARRGEDRSPEGVAQRLVAGLRSGNLTNETLNWAAQLGSWSAEQAVAERGKRVLCCAGGWRPHFDHMSTDAKGLYGWMIVMTTPTSWTGPLAHEPRMRVWRAPFEVRLNRGLPGDRLKVEFEASGIESGQYAFAESERYGVDEPALWRLASCGLMGDTEDRECRAALDALCFLRTRSLEEYALLLGYDDSSSALDLARKSERLIVNALLGVDGDEEKPWLGRSGWWPSSFVDYAEGAPHHAVASGALRAALRALEHGHESLVSCRQYVHKRGHRSSQPEVVLHEDRLSTATEEHAFPGRHVVAFFRGGAGPWRAGASVTTLATESSLSLWAYPWDRESDFEAAAKRLGRSALVFGVDGRLEKETKR